MAADVAGNTNVTSPPKDRQEVPVQILRLLTAHEIILQGARAPARKAAELSDNGTNDLLVRDVIRNSELQVWSWRSTWSISHCFEQTRGSPSIGFFNT